MEFTATGTAVRVAGAAPPATPVVTLMDVDELVKARAAGYAPLGIAMANCVWWEPHCDCMADGSWVNQELPRHNEIARYVEQATVARFRESAGRFGGAGVVGVQLQRRSVDHHEEQHSHLFVEILMFGTAVARVAPAAPTGPRVLRVLDLRGRSPTATSASELRLDVKE
jgi:uncharacterized protein YbjQ (UPF0145 family)